MWLVESLAKGKKELAGGVGEVLVVAGGFSSIINDEEAGAAAGGVN